MTLIGELKIEIDGDKKPSLDSMYNVTRGLCDTPKNRYDRGGDLTGRSRNQMF